MTERNSESHVTSSKKCNCYDRAPTVPTFRDHFTHLPDCPCYGMHAMPVGVAVQEIESLTIWATTPAPSKQWTTDRNLQVAELRALVARERRWLADYPDDEDRQQALAALVWAVSRLEGLPEHWIATDESLVPKQSGSETPSNRPTCHYAGPCDYQSAKAGAEGPHCETCQCPAPGMKTVPLPTHVSMEGQPMGDPHPCDLTRAGCDPVTGRPTENG